MAGAPPILGAQHWADTSSIVEDVSDIIYQITPEDTPFFNMTGDTRSIAVTHEWQQRALTLRQDNAQHEGFLFSFGTAQRLPTRVSNVNQIFNTDVRVTRTQQSIGHYAISDMFADQMTVAMTEVKTAIEHGLLLGTIATGSATDTARRLEGIVQAITSGMSSYTQFNFTTTLTDDTFNGMTQLLWNLGSAPKDVLVGGKLKRTISGFSAGGTKFFSQDDQRVVNTISVYESDFFTQMIHLSRDIPVGTLTGSALWIDRTMINKAWIDTPKAMRVPKTADSDDGIIFAELTLEWGHENAHGYITHIPDDL